MAALGVMGVLGIVSAVGQIGGTILGAVGQRKAGQAQQRVANFEAEQLDLRANEELAASQREGMEIGREQDLVLSRQQALSAAGGGDTQDSTVSGLADDVVRAGTYRSALARYGGNERAKGLRMQAQGARASGQAAVRGANMAAMGTILGGIAGAAGSFYDMFGSGRPTGGSPSYLRYG